MSADRQLYYWCRGQDDNIGDVVLRRVLLRSLDRLGTPHVFIGSASPGFVDGMQFGPTVVTYTSKGRWWMALLRATVRRRGVLVFNPGEVRLDLRSAVAHAVLLPLQVLGRLLKVPSVRAGVAVKGRSALWELPFRASVALTTVNTWRDLESAERYGARASVDWAFRDGAWPDERKIGADERPVLALTFRSDRQACPPSTLQELRRFADDRGLRIVVLVQVRRDREPSARMADELGATLLDWPDERGHWEHELIVRELFQVTRIVVSDRIHALIVGLTEGALPMGLVTPGDDKVERHFRAIGQPEVAGAASDFATSALIAERAEALSTAFADGESLRAARVELDEVDRILTATIVGGGAA